MSADAPDPAGRLGIMHQTKAWVDAQKSREEFSALIDGINAERLRYAFGISAMAAVESSRHNLGQTVRNYGVR
jgi:hypothetical protein